PTSLPDAATSHPDRFGSDIHLSELANKRLMAVSPTE
ncbi:MAG: hypothetical protein ACI91Q_000071, partial [Gammaproteobacteria bacterium]